MAMEHIPHVFLQYCLATAPYVAWSQYNAASEHVAPSPVAAPRPASSSSHELDDEGAGADPPTSPWPRAHSFASLRDKLESLQHDDVEGSWQSQ